MSIPTNCAVCLLEDGLVINKIVAVPSDPPPLDCQLIEIMNGMMCDIGWYWNGTEFINPNPPSPEPEPEPDPVV